MEAKKKDKEIDSNLKEIILSDDSNIPLEEVSFPSNYKPQGEVKLGSKSTEQQKASQHELLEYRKRISKIGSTLTPEDIGRLTIQAEERRRSLEESILLQKQEFMQHHDSELKARQAKALAEARAYRIQHENDTQRAIRVSAEENLKNQRSKELQTLENKRRHEKEDVETFFMQSSNRFNEKYVNTIKKISGETGIDRLVSSRIFSTSLTNKLQAKALEEQVHESYEQRRLRLNVEEEIKKKRYAHRCIVCGYHNPESLSISKIYQHIFENKDSHMPIAFREIDEYYDTQIAETRRRHVSEDNPDERQQRLSKDLQQLQKLKGVHYP